MNSRPTKLRISHQSVGESHYATHLTWDDVRMIRHRRTCPICLPHSTFKQLAADYSVTAPAVHHIAHERSWHPIHDPQPRDVICPSGGAPTLAAKKEWHLDCVDDEDGPLIIMMIPATGHVENVAIARFDSAHAVGALNHMLTRNAPHWPDIVVTDHAPIWSSIGIFLAQLGIAHRLPAPGEILAVENAVRGLMAGLEGRDVCAGGVA